MRKNNKPIYNRYRHGALPDMHTDKAFDIYRRMVGGETGLIAEFLSYFNKGAELLSVVGFCIQL